MLKVTATALQEVLILEYDRKDDARGPVYKMFSKKDLEAAGIYTEFVEEYIYCPAKKGTLYGIHFQNNPKAQTKLIACVKGSGMDYAIDLRKHSKTYRQWVLTELSADNGRQMYIPKGFGHAFVTMENDTQIVYRIDEYSNPGLQRAITYKDTDLSIPFPVENPVLSEQDQNAPSLQVSDCNYQ